MMTDPSRTGVSDVVSKRFTFDRVFDAKDTQEEVFELVSPLVESAVDGFNTTVFAYGCTGSGKTYSMFGTPAAPGIIPRAIALLFDSILNPEAMTSDSMFLVKMTYVELYNGRFRDLLRPGVQVLGDATKIEVRESKSAGVFLSGVTQQPVYSTEEALSLIKKGSEARAVGTTDLNEHSSRSHAIVSFFIESRIQGLVRLGKMHLVDLAGSERVSMSHASGETLTETQNINLSLSTLGDVLSALCRYQQQMKLQNNEKVASVHRQNFVPYRNSKLTHFLKDSLGGNSRTLMLANIRRDEGHKFYRDIHQTLQYAARARSIENLIQVNTDRQGVSQIESTCADIERLQQQLTDRYDAFERLKREQQVGRADNRLLQQKLEQMQLKNTQERCQLEQYLKKVIHSHQSQVVRHQTEYSSLQEQLEDYSQRCSRQQEEIHMLRESVADLEGKRAAARQAEKHSAEKRASQIATLTEKLAAKTQEVEQLKSDLRRFAARVMQDREKTASKEATLREENAALKESNKMKVEEQQSLFAARQEAEAVFKEAQQREEKEAEKNAKILSGLRRSIETLNGRLAEAEEVLKKKDELLRTSNNDKARLEDENNRFRQERSQLRDELNITAADSRRMIYRLFSTIRHVTSLISRSDADKKRMENVSITEDDVARAEVEIITLIQDFQQEKHQAEDFWKRSAASLREELSAATKRFDKEKLKLEQGKKSLLILLREQEEKEKQRITQLQEQMGEGLATLLQQQKAMEDKEAEHGRMLKNLNQQYQEQSHRLKAELREREQQLEGEIAVLEMEREDLETFREKLLMVLEDKLLLRVPMFHSVVRTVLRECSEPISACLCKRMLAEQAKYYQAALLKAEKTHKHISWEWDQVREKLQKDMETLERANTEQSKCIQDLRGKVEVAQHHLSERDKNIEALTRSTEIIDSLEIELEDLSHRLCLAEKKSSDAESKMAMMSQQCEKLKLEMDNRLTETVSNHQREVEKLLELINAETDRRKEWEGRSATLAERCEQLHREVETERVTAEDLSQRLGIAVDERRSVEEQFVLLKRQYGSLQAEVQKEQETAKSFCTKAETEFKRLRLADEKCRVLHERTSELQGNIRSLQEETQNLHRDLATESEKRKTAEDRCIALAEQRDRLQEEVGSSNDRVCLFTTLLEISSMRQEDLNGQLLKESAKRREQDDLLRERMHMGEEDRVSAIGNSRLLILAAVKVQETSEASLTETIARQSRHLEELKNEVATLEGADRAKAELIADQELKMLSLIERVERTEEALEVAVFRKSEYASKLQVMHSEVSKKESEVRLLNAQLSEVVLQKSESARLFDIERKKLEAYIEELQASFEEVQAQKENVRDELVVVREHLTQQLKKTISLAKQNLNTSIDFYRSSSRRKVGKKQEDDCFYAEKEDKHFSAPEDKENLAFKENQYDV